MKQGESSQYPSRGRPAHSVHPVPGRPTIVFLTVCTKARRPWLASQDVHATLCDVWRAASAWLVGRYVVMPDHVHLFAGVNDERFPLDNWVRYWKSLFTRRDANPQHEWQAGYWDTTLRGHESYESKWEYVRGNPVRHQLVEHPEDWEFQGVINELPW